MCSAKPNELTFKIQYAINNLEQYIGEIDERGEVDLDEIKIQKLMMSAIKLYTYKVKLSSNVFYPIANSGDISVTDVMLTTSEMLKAINIEVFELGMWRAWTN